MRFVPVPISRNDANRLVRAFDLRERRLHVPVMEKDSETEGKKKKKKKKKKKNPIQTQRSMNKAESFSCVYSLVLQMYSSQSKSTLNDDVF
jgi:predicted GTPase